MDKDLTLSLCKHIVFSDPGAISQEFHIILHNKEFEGQRGYNGNSKETMSLFSHEVRQFSYSFGMRLADVLGTELIIEENES